MTEQQTLRVREGVKSQEIDGELVLLNPATRKYFGLEGTGKYIWSVLQREHTLEDVVQAVSQRYAVPAYKIGDQIEQFLDHLLRSELLELQY